MKKIILLFLTFAIASPNRVVADGGSNNGGAGASSTYKIDLSKPPRVILESIWKNALARKEKMEPQRAIAEYYKGIRAAQGGAYPGKPADSLTYVSLKRQESLADALESALAGGSRVFDDQMKYYEEIYQYDIKTLPRIDAYYDYYPVIKAFPLSTHESKRYRDNSPDRRTIMAVLSETSLLMDHFYVKPSGNREARPLPSYSFFLVFSEHLAKWVSNDLLDSPVYGARCQTLIDELQDLNDHLAAWNSGSRDAFFVDDEDAFLRSVEVFRAVLRLANTSCENLVVKPNPPSEIGGEFK